MNEQAAILIQSGLQEAAAISNPVTQARHRYAWAFRLSAADPQAAADQSAALIQEPVEQAQLLLTATADAFHAGQDPAPLYTRTLDQAAALDPDTRLRILNSLSELAIEVADTDRERGLALLTELIPAVQALELPGEDAQQYQALGMALVGEGLLVLKDPRGRELLAQAETLSESLPARDPIALFLASALVREDPAASLRLLATIEDPGGRLEPSFQLLATLEDPDLREELLQTAEADARQVAHWRGPEALVLLGQAVATFDRDRARPLFDEALRSAVGNAPQIAALQTAGVATSVAASDPEWAGTLFLESAALAASDTEPSKRATTLALIAGEMAESHPQEAAQVFQTALKEAEQLGAMWEMAHLMDVIFRGDRSPFLDVQPTRPLLERMAAMISDEDPRIPGVLGLAEIGKSMLQVDPERGVELFQRWFRAAEAAGDSDGMTQAALAIHPHDEAAGVEALRKTHDFLIRRVDCPSMGDFCRRAAPIAPELVVDMAPHIPDRRERADALAEAAIGLYVKDPAAAAALIGTLEEPADRSAVLLRIADQLLNLHDRPQVQPLMEEVDRCCSGA